MPLPVVAIVGRPNVGKSSLFNSLSRARISIVEPTAGVTRDRVSTICNVDQHYFELVDMGGHGIVDRDDLGEHVERQIQFALARADLILFVVDARDGLTPLDRQTAALLRGHRSPVVLVANKVDEPAMEAQIGEFARLGFGEPLPVSATSGLGRSRLVEIILESLGDRSMEAPPDPVMKVAIVGKRNAGKSTFINALAGEERVIVSEIPGTTRDSIDVRFEKDGRTLIAIDTAGLQKKRKLMDEPIDYYAFVRARRAIQRADVVLFLIDATVPIGQVDKALAQAVLEVYKPCVLVVNKWDLAKGQAATDEYGDYLDKALPQLDFAPISFTSANAGRNVYATIDLASMLCKQAKTRVSTGKLNQVIQDAVAQNAPRPRRGGRAPKVLFATQVSTEPPTIVVFVNGTELVTADYERFLANRLRERLPFEEIPIRLVFRSRRRGAVHASRDEPMRHNANRGSREQVRWPSN